MSEQEKVNQPQNDVPEVEVKETQTDNKPQPQFTQQDVDRIIKQRCNWEIDFNGLSFWNRHFN